MVIANPTTPYVTGGLVQPALTGFENPAPPVSPVSAPEAAAGQIARRTAAREAGAAATAGVAGVSGEKRSRRRYWSVRDLSRRLWLGRGYELLRHLIRAGILPATRSARSWWIDDEDAASLIAAFQDRAGKVRAFHGLDAWLRERCYVVTLTPEAETLTRLTRSGLAWRGRLYLPMTSWVEEPATASDEAEDEDGDAEPVYRHRSGVALEAGDEALIAA